MCCKVSLRTLLTRVADLIVAKFRLDAPIGDLLDLFTLTKSFHLLILILILLLIF